MVRYVVLGDEDTIADKIITRFGSFNNKEVDEFIQLVVLDKEKNFEWQHTTTLEKETLVQLRNALNIILKNKYGMDTKLPERELLDEEEALNDLKFCGNCDDFITIYDEDGAKMGVGFCKKGDLLETVDIADLGCKEWKEWKEKEQEKKCPKCGTILETNYHPFERGYQDSCPNTECDYIGELYGKKEEVKH